MWDPANWDGTLIRTNQQARWIAWIIGLAITAVTVALIVVALMHQAHASVARRLIVEGFVALCDLVLGALGYRTLRAGVVIGRDKVVVRNLWRSTVVAWDDIDRFAVAGNGPYTTGYVHLRVGTGIATWGIQGQARLLFKNSRWATGPIDTLNTLLAERRARSTA